MVERRLFTVFITMYVGTFPHTENINYEIIQWNLLNFETLLGIYRWMSRLVVCCLPIGLVTELCGYDNRKAISRQRKTVFSILLMICSPPLNTKWLKKQWMMSQLLWKHMFCTTMHLKIIWKHTMLNIRSLFVVEWKLTRSVMILAAANLKLTPGYLSVFDQKAVFMAKDVRKYLGNP